MTKIMVNGIDVEVNDNDRIVIQQIPKIPYDRNSDTILVILHNGVKIVRD